MIATYPYNRLSSMPDPELRGIGEALTSPSCGCVKHQDLSRSEETDQARLEREDWEQAVFSEMERRGLPTADDEREPEPLTCPTCNTPVEVASGYCGDLFAICHKCSTHRQFGDHMDCSFGPIVSGLPNISTT